MMSVIETISDGFSRTTRRIWLIVLPVLVDIAIWAGPRLSVRRLSEQMIASLTSLPTLGADYDASLQQIAQQLGTMGAQTNLLSLLSMRIVSLPSLTGSLVSTDWPLAIARQIIEISSWPALSVVAVTLSLVALLLGCICLSWQAQEAREESFNLSDALRMTVFAWSRLTLILLGSGVGVVLLVVSASVVLGILTALSPSFGALLFGFFSILMMGLATYLSIIFLFTPRAMMLDRVGVRRSLWNSLNVVHRNFLPTLWLILLSNVIQTGLMYIWRAAAVSVAGTLVSIVGHAYVSTGLAIAGIIFYRDRFVSWRETLHSATDSRG